MLLSTHYSINSSVSDRYVYIKTDATGLKGKETYENNKIISFLSLEYNACHPQSIAVFKERTAKNIK